MERANAEKVANAEQIAYWNEVSGPRWVAAQHLLDEQISPLGLAAMERAAPTPGERVLDVGCGCGQTSLQLAERVGPTGRVLGVDVSGPMLARAAERAREAGAGHVSFQRADAQTHGFAPEFDLLFSRFGVMFFEDPVAAFANLRSALRPGGRLILLCWQELRRNDWMRIPVMTVAQHVPLPPPPEPGAPGPFAFGDAERVRGILSRAGFGAVEIDPHETQMAIRGGGALDESVDFLLQLGPTLKALQEADETQRARAREALREELRPYLSDAGVVMNAATWIVSATRE